MGPVRETRVLVVGAGGFVGSNIALTASRSATVVAHTRHPLAAFDGMANVSGDLSDIDVIPELLRAVSPDVVVNCAALADVDACEDDPGMAHHLNCVVPTQLAVESRRRGCQFVHLSTDAVFGGELGPYDVSTRPSPINEYGRSKFAGEIAVLEALPEALVVRTNVIGWSPTGTRSLLEFFVNRLIEQQSVAGFVDVRFRPIAVTTLWPLINAWASNARRTGIGGLRHATGHQLLSKFDFGVLVAQAFGLTPDLIRPTSIADGHLRATRAPALDVLPSRADDATSVDRFTVISDLDHLRALADSGWRDRLAKFRVGAAEGDRR